MNNAGNIKLALHDKFNFEETYSNVFDDRKFYPQEEIDIYKKVVTEVYLVMNDYIVGPNKQRTTDVNKTLWFLNKFLNNTGNKVGGYFTLNQDIFPEYAYNWKPFGPKINQSIRPNTNAILPKPSEIDEYIKNPSDTNPCYIKLHGSTNWLQEDGSETLVIGINKIEIINKIPLLKWYFELFNNAINRKDVRLLIIGYGFQDEHINKCLFDAINSSGLKLYVISPENPLSFKNKLTIKGTHDGYNGKIVEQNHEGITIWKAVQGYFPYRLSDIFPISKVRTAALDEVLRTFS
jgi:hypothetical protein